jgi:hypothetical protein
MIFRPMAEAPGLGGYGDASRYDIAIYAVNCDHITRRSAPPRPVSRIPRFTAGSLQNSSFSAAAASYDNRWPITGIDSAAPISDNLTYTYGPHTLKAGSLWEYERNTQAPRGRPPSPKRTFLQADSP